MTPPLKRVIDKRPLHSPVTVCLRGGHRIAGMLGNNNGDDDVFVLLGDTELAGRWWIRYDDVVAVANRAHRD